MTRVVCRVILLVGVAVAGLAGARPAEACSCVSPGFQLITPAAGQAAPINTRVRVTYVQSWNLPVRVVLVGDDGVLVPARATTAQSGELRVVELVPEGVLRPETVYEVRAIEAGLRDVETVVGSFVTGTGTDLQAPEWRGVRRGVLVKKRRPRRSKRDAARRADPASPCARTEPYAVLVADPAADSDTPGPALLYAVWMPSAGRGLDTSRAPSAYLPAHDGKIMLGSSSSCDPLHLVLPRRGRVKLGVAAVDPAGNQSAPVEVSLRAGRAPR